MLLFFFLHSLHDVLIIFGYSSLIILLSYLPLFCVLFSSFIFSFQHTDLLALFHLVCFVYHDAHSSRVLWNTVCNQFMTKKIVFSLILAMQFQTDTHWCIWCLISVPKIEEFSLIQWSAVVR